MIFKIIILKLDFINSITSFTTNLLNDYACVIPIQNKGGINTTKNWNAK